MSAPFASQDWKGMMQDADMVEGESSCGSSSFSSEVSAEQVREALAQAIAIVKAKSHEKSSDASAKDKKPKPKENRAVLPPEVPPFWLT